MNKTNRSVVFYESVPYLPAMDKTKLTLLLAAPRGFCAGVDRAIQIVERALDRFGAPVYVRHEIVHNKYVVDSLKQKGAVFVDELDELPPESESRPIILSAHGAAASVHQKAQSLTDIVIDATCPLVTKVHTESRRHAQSGAQIILIGHAGHAEVAGTMGQLPDGQMLLVQNESDVQNLVVKDEANLAYATQTTLSVDDTANIIAALRARFPQIKGPAREDICYATTNRQDAVKHIAPQVDAFIIIGAPNSSNSNRLLETARSAGCAHAMLIQRATDIPAGWLEGKTTLGVSAGASATEVLVDELVAHLSATYDLDVQTSLVREENTVFRLPRLLTQNDE